jgi:hypothetical protein
MKTLLIAISALIILGLASCDESTTNPTDNNNDKTLITKEDLLTSTLWERKYVVDINTTDGPIKANRTERLEFNRGLLQNSFYLYSLYTPTNTFTRSSGDEVKWTMTNDTLILKSTASRLYTSIIKLQSITQDTLIIQRISVDKAPIGIWATAPFNDTTIFHTYYKVK